MSKEVNKIFSDMSPNYDRVNKICSSYTMVMWRKAAAKESIPDKHSFSVLDIGTGTGELAFEIYGEANMLGKHADITGMDFSKGMLDVARQKAEKRGARIKFEFGDAMRLKYRDSTFDIVTSSLVVKNVDDQKKFAKEAYRVLKRGGKVVILELVSPKGMLNRALINAYWATVIRIGFIGSSDSYSALKESVDKFDAKRFSKILRQSGFRNVGQMRMFSGAAVLFTGSK